MAKDKCIATDVDSLPDFLDKYMKHDRYKGQGDDYALAVLESHEESINRFSHTLISKHESRTGEAVWYYPKWAHANE